MNPLNESKPVSAPANAGDAFAEQAAITSPAPVVIDPNNPPWGLWAAALTWIASVALLFGISLLFVLPYAMIKCKGCDEAAFRQFLTTDQTALLLQIVSTIPVHILTLGVTWAVITNFGKRPFWQALGWTWSKRFGFWKSVGLAVVLYILGILLIWQFGQSQTSLDNLVASSRAAALAIAFLAVFTAPLAEEVVYRGVLFSALQKRMGMRWAIVGVLALFTLVHVPQYWPNFGIIGVIGLLSISLTLVRAYTGRLLPCFVMHTVFNGIQSVLIVLEPYLPHSMTNKEQKVEALIFLARTFGGLS